MAKAESAAPEPRKRDAERTRARILKAATREFGLHGFSGARTEKIADLAKSNIRLLYHHFGSKEGLYAAALEATYDDLRKKEAALEFDLEAPLDCVEQRLRFTFKYFEEKPYFEGLLRTENMMRGRFVRESKLVPEAAATLKSRLNAIVAAGEAMGVFRADIDVAHLYVTITALSRFHLANSYSLSALMSTDLRSSDWRSARLEHCVDVLRAYLRHRSDVVQLPL